MNSKSFSSKLVVRGALLLLGLLLFFFFVYPPLLLFVRGRSVLFQGDFYRYDFLSPLITSLQIAIGVFLLSAVTGGLLAWIVVKTDFRYKQLIDNFTLVAFAVPPYLLALSWLQIFGRNGYAERIIRTILPGSGWHSQPYSVAAVIVVMSLHLYPLMFMSIRNSLEQINPDMEKAALICGASGIRVSLGISLPLVLPNLFSTGLLVFSRTMANFAVPALLCLPKGIEVVSTGIYSSLSSLRVDYAAALSLMLVAISTLLYLGQAAVLRKKHIHLSLGSGRIRGFFRMGRGSMICLVVLIVFFGLSLFLPFGSMLVSSFLKRWGLPLEAKYLTLANYAEIFNPHGKAALAFKNSLVFGGTAAVLASIIGGGTAVAVRFMKTRLSLLFESAASCPMAIPNTVLAVAAIFAWNKAPLRLYGTSWVIIVTYTVLFTPIVLKQVSGLLQMQDANLLKAARLSGASGLRSFIGISLPLLFPGFKSGILICMMIALREIPISLLLYSSGQETVGVLLFGMQSQSFGLEMTSALAIIVLAIIITGNLLTGGRGRNKL